MKIEQPVTKVENEMPNTNKSQYDAFSIGEKLRDIDTSLYHINKNGWDIDPEALKILKKYEEGSPYAEALLAMSKDLNEVRHLLVKSSIVPSDKKEV